MLSTEKIAVGLITTFLMTFQVANAAPKRVHLKLRQPQKVATVHNSWQRELSHDLFVATASVENLDGQLESLMNASGMNFLQRWKAGLDQATLQKRFAEDMGNHLQLMAGLFKRHHDMKRFDRLSEFEFQNLVRRSDYILSLDVSRASIERNMSKSKFAIDFKRVLATYNQERLRFDQKMISLVSNK